MARLPRLALAGQAHLVALYGHSAQPVFVDDEDRRQFLAALRESALLQQVAVHAYVLLDDHVHLLLTPGRPDALGALMQGLGRRYGAGFNRRHGRRGSLWAGRFRATVVQPGAPLLDAMLFIDHHPVRSALVAAAPDHPWCSARHHLGRLRDPLITECSAWWALGNTPFEREAAYLRLLGEGLAPARAAALAQAGRKGWPVGDDAFLATLARQSARPLQPRPRGRPRKLGA
ncbi:MAG: transposase [Burkholderiaceae bacterium]|nr:transposase [Burkholderiaceae bacterium]